MEHSRTILLDVLNMESLRRAITTTKAKTVINCAGLTSVDICESHPEASVLVNAVGASNVSQAVQEEGIRLIHISTDHFASSSQVPRTETDPVFAVNQYGFAKLLAEGFITAQNPNALVLRTNFFGSSSSKKETFFNQILQKFTEGQQVQGFHDITFSPIGIETLCAFIQTQLFASTKGLVNVVGGQELTKLDFAIEVKNALADSRSSIHATSIKDAGLLAKRPSYMSLSIERLTGEFGFSPPSLSHMIGQEIEIAQRLSTSSRI